MEQTNGCRIDMIMYMVVARETGLIDTDCSNPITQRPKEVSHVSCVDLYSERTVCSVTSGFQDPR